MCVLSVPKVCTRQLPNRSGDKTGSQRGLFHDMALHDPDLSIRSTWVPSWLGPKGTPYYPQASHNLNVALCTTLVPLPPPPPLLQRHSSSRASLPPHQNRTEYTPGDHNRDFINSIIHARFILNVCLPVSSFTSLSQHLLPS